MTKRGFLWFGLLLLPLAAGLASIAGLLPGRRSGSKLPDNHVSSGNEPVVGTMEVAWTFEPVQRGSIVSSPLVAGDRVYAAVIHDAAFFSRGAVYCLERGSGRVVWQFDDAGQMLHMFSSPCLAGGRLFIGDGMHHDQLCKLYCLDAASGRKHWHFATTGHIESSPCVAGGRVYFAAGDEGIYCLDAENGAQRWQFTGPFHVDTSPAVVADRVYAGSGISVKNQQTELFCLDSMTGRVVWRVPTDLPVWGDPSVDGDEVFFGLGNGRLLEPPPPPVKPAGAVWCVEAATGRLRWRWSGEDAVFCRPVVAAGHVYFGSRDGSCYCLERDTGRLAWHTPLDGAIVARPALAGTHVYAVTSKGRVCRLDAATGHVQKIFDVAAHTQTRPQVFSSPTVVADADAAGACWIYFGTELVNAATSAAVLYCLRDGDES